MFAQSLSSRALKFFWEDPNWWFGLEVRGYLPNLALKGALFSLGLELG